MNIKFKTLLIGADDEDSWLCNLKHSKIKVERKLYSDFELKEKYSYFKLDSRWPFWFDTEEGKNICYELVYIEEVDNYTEDIINNRSYIIFFENEERKYFRDE